MSDHISNLPLPALNEIDLQASSFVLRQGLPGWSDTDQTTLDTWLAQSPHHKVAYLRHLHVWSRADRLQALQNPAQTDTGQNLTRLRRTPQIKNSFARIAAALTLISACSLGGYLYLSQPRETLYATAIGGHETVPLSDGTQIELNTDTRIRVSETKARRIVRLEKGEAFFDVKHNAARPFIVYAADHRIVDIGTQFRVHQQGGTVRVAMLEGSAEISKDTWRKSPAKLLLPGDMAVATAQTVAVTKHPLKELESDLSWRKGTLHFRHSTLAQVVAELNRYNSQQLQIDDPKVAALRISATISTTNLDGFIRLAQDVFNIRVRARDNAILLSQ